MFCGWSHWSTNVLKSAKQFEAWGVECVCIVSVALINCNIINNIFRNKSWVDIQRGT